MQLPRHPGVCSTAEILSDLDVFETEHRAEDRVVMLLPTAGEKPLTSPRFGLELSDEELKLKPWLIPAVRLSPEEAVNLLTYSPPSIPDALKYGDSFRFWREVSKLLLEMLTRGRFLPSVKPVGDAWHACWKILPAKQKDFGRLEILAASMPPICRAYQAAESEVAPETQELLESFLEWSSDALIRRFLSRQSLSEDLESERNRLRFTEELSWLRGLTRTNSLLEGTKHKLVDLEKRFHLWVDKLVPSSERSALQTCFRLLEPEDTSSDFAEWKVQIFPSLTR